MRILGFDVTIRKALQPPLSPIVGARGGWFPIVREPFTGAWQQNQEIRADSALSYFAVFACATLIASDIGKLRLRLVALDGNGVWHETTSPAFSPVLRKPNSYQTIQKFCEHWIISKLITGNVYALKERDDRGVVRALYILDPTRVQVLIAPDGSVFYSLGNDALAGINDGDRVVVPASHIIHDLMVPLFHPLIGVSPIFACGLSAIEGLRIQESSTQFFANGSRPGGTLTAPGEINQSQADDYSRRWEEGFGGAKQGRVAVLGNGLKYEPLSMSAVDAQLIEQLKWTAETVCSAFHVPPSMIGVGPLPPYANSEPLVQQYYNCCLQSLIVAFENSLDAGLELPTPYGTEFDVNDLIWMDTATKTSAASESIKSGGVSPDEARKIYFGLGPVEGGNTPYMQQQMYSLAALAKRDAADPFAKPAPAPAPDPDDDDPDPDDLDDDAIEKAAGAYFQAAL